MGVDLSFVENRLKIEKSLIKKKKLPQKKKKERKQETTSNSTDTAAIKF